MEYDEAWLQHQQEQEVVMLMQMFDEVCEEFLTEDQAYNLMSYNSAVALNLIEGDSVAYH